METTIKITSVIPPHTSVALLYAEGGALPLTLTPEEEELLKKKTEKGNSCLIQRLPGYLFLVKVADEKNPSIRTEKIRKAGAEWIDIVKREKIDRISLAGTGESGLLLAFLEGFLLGGYDFPKYRKEKENFSPSEITLCDAQISQQSVDELKVLANAMNWARDMVNEPLSYLTATRFSEEISEKGQKAGFEVEIFHKQKIEALKMGGLLGVNRGSIDPPTFTVMEWKPEKPVNTRPVVLVGKGVVYDTGGLSLKPTLKSMDYMKSDMAGAAAVAATLYIAAALKLPVHVVGLVPATDNRPDGNAITPGDVITISDGTTVEVLNTDAEGRLILADALSYAKRYEPKVVIDLATLTGAASIISGTHAILAMGNTPEHINQLKVSGDAVFERIIDLPLWEEFALPLKSDIADLSNTGGRDGQTIVAGKFLEHFTDYPWIHLDIAGTAFIFEKEGYRAKGSTGSGIRLLFNFLKNLK